MIIPGNNERSESKQLLEVVLSHTPIMSVYLDARFNFIWVNPAYAETCKHDPSFFPGKNHFELYPNAENQAIFQRVVDSGEPHRVLAKPFEFPDQPERGVTYWDWSLVPVKDSAGKTTGLVFTLMDATDRVRAELAASESATLFQAVFEQAIDGMLLADMKTRRFIRANRQIQRLLGYTESEILQLTVKDIHPAADLPWIMVFFEKQVRGEMALAPELPMLRKDGTVFYADVTAAVVHVREGRFVLGIFRDITDRKQAQARLREVVAELARSNKDLEQFAYVASHDLKEPLRMVTGFMSLLKERYQDKLDVAAAEYISFAEEGGIRMQMLVDDLLAYSRVGRSGMIEPVDFGAALDEALMNLKASIDETGTRVARDPLPVIKACGVEIIQLFQNLIGNAIKFHREGVSPEIDVNACREGDSWLFRVRDNGIGIPPEQREKVFLIFQRLHVPDKYPGTGIGLAICKKIVERHGGKIGVEANEGGGSVFCFTIPA